MEPDREARLASVVDAAPDAIITKRLDGTIVDWNAGATAMYGYDADLIIGQSIFLLVPYDGRDEVTGVLERVAQGETVEHFDTTRVHKDGTHVEVSINFAPLRDADGTITGVVSIARDITERKKLERQLAQMALHDPLTGLPNRSVLEDRLEQWLARCRRTETGVAVLFIDLDHFKSVNDRFGHTHGDAVLATVGRRLAVAMRAMDTVARHGGDEFVVVAGDTVTKADVVHIAARVLHAFDEVIHIGTTEVQVTASIGVVWSVTGDESPRDLMNLADAAMYQAKADGRARVYVANA